MYIFTYTEQSGTFRGPDHNCITNENNVNYVVPSQNCLLGKIFKNKDVRQAQVKIFGFIDKTLFKNGIYKLSLR